MINSFVLGFSSFAQVDGSSYAAAISGTPFLHFATASREASCKLKVKMSARGGRNRDGCIYASMQVCKTAFWSSRLVVAASWAIG